MQAGRLKHLVIIERPLDVETDNGEGAIAWQEVARDRARIEPLGPGREALSDSGPVADGDVRITLRRWRSSYFGMTAQWRIRRGTTIYNLREPPPFVPRQSEAFVLDATTGANQG